MKDNTTSWQLYNTERPQTGAVNEPVEELRLLTDSQRESAEERLRELIETSRREILEDN